MFSRCNLLDLYCIVMLLLLYLIPSISSISCYVCESTFPASNVCLPPCSQTFQLNSTCQLTRNIPLDASDTGSVSADHISGDPVLSNAIEKNFFFGEEAVYLNPSGGVGWDWEYGPITYGCDTSGCNDPQNVNRLPNALNARIPDNTLNQLLVGELDSSCNRCDICVDENAPSTNTSACTLENCPSQSCSFVATRSSTTSIAQCGSAWYFTSGCLSRESAQVDMTLMYYIRSQTTVLYQMKAICLSNNCNNFNTFIQLKNAITVDPDLSCFINDTSSSTTTSTSTSTTSTTTSKSPVDYILMNNKLFIIIIFFLIYIYIKQ